MTKPMSTAYIAQWLYSRRAVMSMSFKSQRGILHLHRIRMITRGRTLEPCSAGSED